MSKVVILSWHHRYPHDRYLASLQRELRETDDSEKQQELERVIAEANGCGPDAF